MDALPGTRHGLDLGWIFGSHVQPFLRIGFEVVKLPRLVTRGHNFPVPLPKGTMPFMKPPQGLGALNAFLWMAQNGE